MIINRHNYEELFLLYIDNELNDLDRAAVEHFVQQNPDLAQEMEMLKQTVLPAENISFKQKEILFSKPDEISVNNYQEYFLLSLDNELALPEKEQVEKFVLMHPGLQNEFALLQQTRLEPENIVFSGKEKLYKKERKEKPVIFFNRMSISAAAAVIGITIATWLFFQKNSNKQAGNFVADAGKQVKRLPETIQQEKPVILLHDIAGLQKIQKAEKTVTAKDNPAKVTKAVERKDAFAVNDMKSKLVQKPGLAVEDEEVVKAPVPDKKAFEEAIASAKIEKSPNVLKKDQNDERVTAKPAAEPGATLVKQVIYTEINTAEDDEEKSLYIGSAQINKNKLKGLFKKAASFLGARNNNNDRERTVKIAGFEIKSK